MPHMASLCQCCSFMQFRSSAHRDDKRSVLQLDFNLAPSGSQAVARLTGDNVVLLLRVRAAEEAAAAAASERDMLRLAVEERRGPWFEQAGVHFLEMALEEMPNRRRCRRCGMLRMAVEERCTP